jgi:hypothetical protein
MLELQFLPLRSGFCGIHFNQAKGRPSGRNLNTIEFAPEM